MQEYNALLGQKISLEELDQLIKIAKQKEQTYLYNRLIKIREFAIENDYERFEIETPAIEQLPGTMLNGVEPLPSYIDFEDMQGLNAAVSPDDIYQYITDLMINSIKEVGHLPWQREWSKTSYSKGYQAVNFDSKKPYRGINFFLANFKVISVNGVNVLASRIKDNPYYLTFNQIEKHGGKLKEGSKAVRVIYFTKLYKHSEIGINGEKLEFGTYNQRKFLAWIKKNQHNLNILKRKGWDIERLSNQYIPILKYYNIFNGADIEGIEWGEFPQNENATKSDKEKIEVAEQIIKSMPNAPLIKFGGNQPAYYPTTDHVLMTEIDKFTNEHSYYSTLFHELTHSTGHKTRLSRPGITLGRYKTERDKAFEELIAEMGAVYLSAESGIFFSIRDNSAKYLQSWNKALVKNLEDDNRFFFRAASQAQASTDYILDRDKKGMPAYLKALSKKIKPKDANDTDVATTYTKQKFIDDLPSYETIRRSYLGISFSPEKRAKSEVKSWGDFNHEVYHKYLQKAQKANEKETTADKSVKRDFVKEFQTQFDKLYPRLLKRKEKVISTRAGLLSAMITGPAGFPVRSQQKKQGYYDNALGDYFKYLEYFEGKLDVTSILRVIRSGEKDTLPQLKDRLKELEIRHEMMKRANAALREYRKSEDLSVIEKYELTDPQILKDFKWYIDNPGFSFPLANSNATIRTLKQRIKGEENRAKHYADGNKTYNLKQFKVVENVEENRLQLIFDGKPSEEVRNLLKKNGYRWSRKFGAWQRQLTTNAISNLNRVVYPKLKELLGDDEPTPPTPPTPKTKETKQTNKTTKSREEINPTKKQHKSYKGIVELDLKDIHLSEKRFQNRTKLNEHIVNNIVENYTETDFDPLIVWHDNKDDKTYLIAGHHRFEAKKRLKHKTAPSKYANEDYPTEADAIRYARELSNANRTLEQEHERAKVYRRKIKEGATKAELEKEAAIEGRNRSYILNLAHLNEKGKTLQTLVQFADSSSVQDKNEVNKIADWIGQARRNNNKLTNAHENEMFEFLSDKNSSRRITNKAQFIQLIVSTTSDMFYDYDKPLNLKRFKYQSQGEKQYDEEVNQLQTRIRETQESISNIQDRFTNPNNKEYINADHRDYDSIKSVADKRISELNNEIRTLQRELQELYRNKSKYTRAGANQTALFGAKRKKPKGVENILATQDVESEFFKVPGAVGEFLQQVEKKPVHSVVITMDGAQGAGKTTTLYRFLDSFASAGKPCVYFSLEEHPQSHLAREKAKKFINPSNVDLIDTVGELDNQKQFYDIVDAYDFIFIDSWQKLLREIGNIRLDEDLRKKFDGKVFVIIFQQTTTGRTKGGAEIVFDGDIIIKMVKEARFEDNYAYMDKNRYTLRPIDELRYNIAKDYTYNIYDKLNAEEVNLTYEFETE